MPQVGAFDQFDQPPPLGVGGGGGDERFAGGAVPDRHEFFLTEGGDARKDERFRQAEDAPERRAFEQVRIIGGGDGRGDGGVLGAGRGAGELGGEQRHDQRRMRPAAAGGKGAVIHGLKRRETVTVPVMRWAGPDWGVSRRYLTTWNFSGDWSSASHR